MSSKRKRNVAIVDPQVADDYSQEDSEQSESSEDDSDDSIEQMPDEKVSTLECPFPPHRELLPLIYISSPVPKQDHGRF